MVAIQTDFERACGSVELSNRPQAVTPIFHAKMDFDRYAKTYEREVDAATRFARLPTEFFLEVKVTHLLGNASTEV